jgi:hypothetical protein
LFAKKFKALDQRSVEWWLYLIHSHNRSGEVTACRYIAAQGATKKLLCDFGTEVQGTLHRSREKTIARGLVGSFGGLQATEPHAGAETCLRHY